MYYLPQQKIKRTGVVSSFEAFFLSKHFNETIFPFHINATVGSRLKAIWLQEDLWK